MQSCALEKSQRAEEGREGRARWTMLRSTWPVRLYDFWLARRLRQKVTKCSVKPVQIIGPVHTIDAAGAATGAI